MMKHIAEGLMRRMHDDPLAAPSKERAHLDGCALCRERLSAISADADRARALMAPPPAEVDGRAAYARFASRMIEQGAWVRRSRPKMTPRAWGAGAAAVAVAAALLAAPAGSHAQPSSTVIFEPLSVAPVSVALPQDVSKAGPGLGPIGTAAAGLKPAADLSAAEQATGLSLTLPTALPPGLSPKASFSTLAASSTSFTLTQAKMDGLAKRYGKALPPLPKSIDGTVLTVSRGAAIVGVFGPASSASASMLIVGKMAAPKVSSTGATLSELEAYALSMPGAPAGLRQELASIVSPKTTLPIPVPKQGATSSKVTVSGQPGVFVKGTKWPLSAVIWERGGAIYAVAGNLGESGLLKVAGGVS